MTRSSVIITGLIGLVAGIFLTAVCLYVTVAGYIPVILVRPLFVWGLFFFLLFFSLAEIPVMIYGMRSIAANNHPRAKKITLLTNTGYTFFAAVYAVPFILLTANSTLIILVGTFLGLLCIARFITSIIFLPDYAEQ